MKKYLAAFMALAMAATALTGCGGGESAGGDDSNKTYKVAYIARAQSDSFAAWLANEMVAAADKYDDIELKVFDCATFTVEGKTHAYCMADVAPAAD